MDLLLKKAVKFNYYFLLLTSYFSLTFAQAPDTLWTKTGGFNQKWFIPRGISDGAAGRICICDTDRDGNFEFIFTTYGGSFTIYFYELHLPNTWEVDSFPYVNSPLLWDIGDFDLDGLWDIVFQASAGPPNMLISIAESPDSFSYPTQEVWRDTVGFPLVTPICTYDIDQDGFPEIVKVCGDYTDLDIYESIEDNLYEKIAEITTASTHTSSSTLAFEDFDLDGQNEFVWGYTGGEYSIWECVGDNAYQEIILQNLSTLNIKDCFYVPDADGDGKMEFVVKGFVIPSAEIHAFIFEAIGDNTYEIIKTFTLPGGDYYGGYSDAGDVDGDSIPEIVLEARQNVFIIKSAGNDSFYVWDTLPGHNSGSNVRIYDIDANGLSEIVISGNNQTRIYEYDPGGIEEAQSRIHKARLEVYPNPFRNNTNIRWQIKNNGKVCLTIYDATGRIVKEFNHLTNQQILWSGTDDLNRKLPSGVYFLIFQAGDYSTTEKLLLIR